MRTAIATKMDKQKKNHYYKYIVKRHLNDIRVHIGLSKN